MTASYRANAVLTPCHRERPARTDPVARQEDGTSIQAFSFAPGSRMLFVRWSATSRTLPTDEVNGSFEEHRDEILLFSFSTDRMDVEAHTGQLSVKFVTRGEELYRFGNRLVALQPDRVLTVNAGEEYSSRIEQAGTQSTAFFLPPAAVTGAMAVNALPESTLLESPAPAVEGATLPAVAFRPGPALEPRIGRLAGALHAVRTPSRDRLEELVMETAAAAVREAMHLSPSDGMARYARRSTREELLARVLRARDLVQDTGGQVTLDRMAAAACLSKFHFLRAFRDAFGMTPAQYARRVRIERGAARIRRGARPRAAARHAGYSSSSTFLRAARRTIG